MNSISITKYIIDTVDLKFEKIHEKLESTEKALLLRESNLRKDLDHLNNLKQDYEKQKLKDQENYVKIGEYSIQHKLVVDKIEFLQKMIYIGLGALLAIEFILKYLNK
jgi:hypothetical protein